MAGPARSRAVYLLGRSGITEQLARNAVFMHCGTTDIQVSSADCASLGSPTGAADLALIDGMNHILKTVGPDLNAQVRSYSDPSIPISEELAPAIVSFVDEYK